MKLCTMSQTIKFFLNGQKQLASVRPDMTVLDWLRSAPRLTGTKEGCAEGDCGACSVLIGDPSGDSVRYHAANSCILAMSQIDGRAKACPRKILTRTRASAPLTSTWARS